MVDAAAAMSAARMDLLELGQRTQRAATRACSSLSSLQYQAGYWLGNLTADTTLESDYILLLLALPA